MQLLKISLLVFILSITQSAQNNTFVKTYITEGISYGRDVIELEDGYLVVGSTTPYSTRLLTIKTDLYGNLIWNKQIGRIASNANSVTYSNSSNDFMIAGGTVIQNDSDKNIQNIYILKINSDGDTLWTKIISNVKNTVAKKVINTSNGGYALVGWIEKNNNDIYLLKINENGDTLFTKTYGDLDTDLGNDVHELPDKGFAIVGTSSGGVEPDYYSYSTVIRTDSLGRTLWFKKFNLNENADGSGIALSVDGGFIITGSTLGENHMTSDIYILKTDENGDSVWFKCFGGELFDWASSIQRTSDGGYIIAGSTYSYGSGDDDLYLLKSDADGNLLWSKTFGGTASDNGLAVRQTQDGGYITSGVTGNSYDVFLVKTDKDGLVNVEDDNFCPFLFYLLQNYPNPFNPSTNLQYAISSRQFVTLKIYDLLGREVATLVNEEKPAGEYEVEFNATNLPSGIYFYQLKAGNFIETRKMILLK